MLEVVIISSRDVWAVWGLHLTLTIDLLFDEHDIDPPLSDVALAKFWRNDLAEFRGWMDGVPGLVRLGWWQLGLGSGWRNVCQEVKQDQNAFFEASAVPETSVEMVMTVVHRAMNEWGLVLDGGAP